MDLCKTNIFLKKLTERTNVTNSYIVKGSKWNLGCPIQ
jgi:hypothetical protein